MARELFDACKSYNECYNYFKGFDEHHRAELNERTIPPFSEHEQRMFDAFSAKYCKPYKKPHSLRIQDRCTRLTLDPKTLCAELERFTIFPVTINDRECELSYLALGITQSLIYLFVEEEQYSHLIDLTKVESASTGIAGFSEIADSDVQVISPQCLTFMRPESLDAIFDASVVMVNRGDTTDFTDFYEARKAQKDNFAQQVD